MFFFFFFWLGIGLLVILPREVFSFMASACYVYSFFCSVSSFPVRRIKADRPDLEDGPLQTILGMMRGLRSLLRTMPLYWIITHSGWNNDNYQLAISWHNVTWPISVDSHSITLAFQNLWIDWEAVSTCSLRTKNFPVCVRLPEGGKRVDMGLEM